MDIKTGKSRDAYIALGVELAGLSEQELLWTFEGLRSGHDVERQQSGQARFVGADYCLKPVMERLFERVARQSKEGGETEQQVMA